MPFLTSIPDFFRKTEITINVRISFNCLLTILITAVIMII